MNYSQHDELAALFAKQMTFHTVPPTHIVVDSKALMDDNAKLIDRQPTTFVSTHYIHPTHIPPSARSDSEPSRSPPPPYGESVLPEAMTEVLMRNSIDPSSLLPNQITLFMNAHYEQRLRLLELWRISPPSYLPLEEHVDASWGPTTMEQEESLARVRYETALLSQGPETYRNSRLKSAAEFDTHEVQMSPIREDGEAAWPPAARMRAASIAASRPSSRPVSQAEPHMVSGYQNNLPYSEPGHSAGASLWRTTDGGQEQIMTDRYGEAMQIRNHAEWEAANQRAASRAFAGDEMMM